MHSPSNRATRHSRVVAFAVAASVAAALVSLGATAPALAATDAADPVPENVVLTPAADAATAQAFTWRTGTDVQDGQVHLRKLGAADWRVVDARVNEELVSAGVQTRTHSVTIDGLEPKTQYEYFVGSAAAQSDTFTFTTAGAAGDPFSFIYFGDAQNDIAAKWTPVVKQAFDRFPDAVGTVNAGDLVNTGGRDEEWSEWFGAMDGYSQTRNVIAAPGNHEYGGDSFLKAWKSNFEFPDDGPVADGAANATPGELQKAAYEAQMERALTETAYYTDYQGVRFISLNASRGQAVALMTPDDLPECLIACPNPTELWLDMQSKWLDRVLKDNPNKWAAAVFHQPVFSAAEGRDEVDVRESWLPVFQRNDIDLVLMGHDHTYARGFVNADATDVPGMTTGPVYTVAVSGPKYYELAPADDNVWTQNGATQVITAGHTSTFQGITVTKDQIRYESVIAAKWDDQSTTDKAIGETLDSFTITKYDDGEKFVTEDGMPIPAPSGTGPATQLPSGPEEPASTPADVPLAHDITGSMTAPTVAKPGPTTVNPSTGVVYVADHTADSRGLIEAVDPATGGVVDSFEAGVAISDIAFDTAFNGLLVTYQDGRIASFLTNPAVFGEPYIDPIPTGLDVVSIQYDAFTGQVFLATPDGTIIWLDENFRPAGQSSVGAGVASIRLDDVTGVLYVVYDNATDGAPGLRLFETRNGMSKLAEYPLDAGASSVDIDMKKGLAYVGHRAVASANAGGVSVIDLIGEKVSRLTGSELGSGTGGVGVDAKNGIAYVSVADRQPAALVVLGRDQAPSVVESPRAQTADKGTTVTFTASARGIPAPTVTWESRSPRKDKWVHVTSGATGDAGAAGLEVRAKASVDGTQYRAVFTNTIDGVEYTTYSATATLRVANDRAGNANGKDSAPGQSGR